jgi:hypothetical protein
MTHTVYANNRQVFSGKDYYVAHEIACRVSESPQTIAVMRKGCNCRVDCPHSSQFSTYQDGRIVTKPGPARKDRTS